jgi:hypothetical protein
MTKYLERSKSIWLMNSMVRKKCRSINEKKV